jgi:hypothetical protein
MKEFPRKFLSLRDKNGTGRRSKSVAPAPSIPAIPDGTGNKSKVCLELICICYFEGYLWFPYKFKDYALVEHWLF